MKVLVKLGGTLVDEPERRANLAGQLAKASRQHSLVVVHGGGKQLTKFLEERGIQSTFVRGLRVSDETVIEAITKVIAGTVNQQLVSALIAAGANAVGLSGIDGLLTEAEQLDPELGFVGRPVRTNARLLELLLPAGYLPTIACIAGDRSGNVYNVNADRMAVSCAVDWKADQLLFLTDVPGVKDGMGRTVPHLTTSESRQLISDGVAHGGMQAKLEAAESAIMNGVSEVVIAPGREEDICARLLAGEAVGTRIQAEVQTA